jgi:hypothetical protein
MPKITEIGTGITKQAKPTISVEVDGQEKFETELAKNLNYLEEMNKKFGNFGSESLEAKCVSQKILGAEKSKLEGENRHNDWPDHSQEWFAHKILFNIKETEDYIKIGNADEAASLAFRVGSLWATAVMKFSWEKDALFGQETRKGRARGGKARRKFYDRINSLLDKEPNLNANQIVKCFSSDYPGEDSRSVQRAATSILKERKDKLNNA